VDPNKGYWQRQFYFLSSLGIFYLILIALFAIPLLGTVVVILIKGALDLRYVIIVFGCLAIIVVSWMAVKIVVRMWRRFRRDGSLAGQEVRRNLLLGKPVEISIFHGMFKFSCGRSTPDPQPGLPQEKQQQMLPFSGGQTDSATLLDQLQHLSELKQSGAITEGEFNRLKAVILESSGAGCEVEKETKT
jgi:hypothetical protein